MWNLIRKDLIRRWRNPAPNVVMLIFPLFMTLMIGTISRGFSGDETPRIKLLLLDRDNTQLTDFLLGSFGQEEMAKRFEAIEVGEEGFQLMEDGKASALVVFPKGFSDSLLAGASTALQVVRNPAEGIFPEIVEVGAGVLAAYLHQGSRLLGDDLKRIQQLSAQEGFPETAVLVELARSVIEKVQGARPVLFPPLVEVKSVKEESADGKSGDDSNAIMAYLLIMTTVMSVLFVTIRSVMDLFEERQSGMLRRQLVTPASVTQIVVAKYVFGVLFSLLMLMVLALIGGIMRWYSGPIDVLGVVVLSVAFSLGASGLLSLVFSLVTTEKQAGALGWILVMGMSALGGSMVPLEVLPAALKSIAPFTLNYWAVRGYNALVLEHQGLSHIAGNIGALAAFGAVTMLFAHALTVRKIRRGFI